MLQAQPTQRPYLYQISVIICPLYNIYFLVSFTWRISDSILSKKMQAIVVLRKADNFNKDELYLLHINVQVYVVTLQMFHFILGNQSFITWLPEFLQNPTASSSFFLVEKAKTRTCRLNWRARPEYGVQHYCFFYWTVLIFIYNNFKRC